MVNALSGSERSQNQDSGPLSPESQVKTVGRVADTEKTGPKPPDSVSAPPRFLLDFLIRLHLINLAPLLLNLTLL